jgi:hypothetical protein
MMSQFLPRLWKLLRCLAVLTATLGGAAGPACAAEQGEIGAMSRGSVGISVSVAARAEVAGVMDAALVPTGYNGTATALQRICIRTNSATLGYDIAASGPVAGDAFALPAADGSSLPIALAWTDAADGPAALLPGVPLHGLTASREDCSAGAAATLAVAAPVSDVPAVGVITLTFSPL